MSIINQWENQVFLFIYLLIYLCHSQRTYTTHLQRVLTFFMCFAVRLVIIWEPIPNPAFPGFEPGTSTMPSEHVGTELTGPLVSQIRVVLDS